MKVWTGAWVMPPIPPPSPVSRKGMYGADTKNTLTQTHHYYAANFSVALNSSGD